MAAARRGPRDVWSDYKLTALKILLAVGAAVLVTAQLIPPLSVFLSNNSNLGVAFLLGLAFLLLDTVLSPASERKAVESRFPRVLEHTSDLGLIFPEWLKQDELTIKLASYSSETFYSVLSSLFDRMNSGDGKLRNLRIQLLLPDCAAPMGIPCLIDTGKESPAYKRHLILRTDRFVREFTNSLERLSTAQPQIRIEFEVRTHRVSPLFKLALIDQAYAYYGIYPVDRTPVMLGNKEQIFLDYRGERVSLSLANKAAVDPSEASIFKSLNAWFDMLWINYEATSIRRTMP